FIGVIALLVGVIIYSAVTGSIDVSASELIKDLFTGSNENIEIIKDLRLPRIIISLFASAALPVALLLLHAVIRNPLVEPRISGVSLGSLFVCSLMVFFFPTLFFYSPLFSFLGLALLFLVVFVFSWISGLDPLRMILIGVEINA